MFQGTDDYDVVLEIIGLINSTGNNDLVGDNEGPAAAIFTRSSGNRKFL